jgi:hypothetical protein
LGADEDVGLAVGDSGGFVWQFILIDLIVIILSILQGEDFDKVIIA